MTTVEAALQEAPGSMSNDANIAVRTAGTGDLGLMASWQTRFLPYGLFPRLGHRFVRRWHATFLNAPYGVALIAEQDGPGEPVPVGFLVGSTDQHRHVADVIRRHRCGLGVAGAAALALRPRTAVVFLRTRVRTYFRRLLVTPESALHTDAITAGARTQDTPRQPGTAVITAVAVEPDARGSGAGRDLVMHFLSVAKSAGAARAELVVIAGPGSAEAFYERLGWVAVEEHLSRDGSNSKTYRYEFKTEAQP